MTDGRRRIALIVDAHDWAFANIARRVASHVDDEFDCELHFQADYPGEELYRLAHATLGAGYDLVHFLWRLALTEFLADAYLPALLSDESLEALLDRYFAQRITASVHDHVLLEASHAHHRQLLFDTCAVGYHVSSRRLDEIYRGLGDIPPPDRVIEDGVDQAVFRPADLGRLADPDRELVVGWAGNSRWNQVGADTTDYKGLHTVIKPAVEALRSRGVPVMGRYRDRAEAWLPAADIPAYFAGIDVYVCASLTEGTATPVLEAMACGLPVVSTDVGIVSQLFGPLQRQFLLSDRSVEGVAAALERLSSDPALRMALSQENLERIRPWTWEATAERWREFFRAVLRHRCGVGNERRACCSPVERRARLRSAALDSLERVAVTLYTDRLALRAALADASTAIADASSKLEAREADTARIVAELDDARRWAHDVEARLASVTVERDELRTRLVTSRMRVAGKRLLRNVMTKRSR